MATRTVRTLLCAFALLLSLAPAEADARHRADARAHAGKRQPPPPPVRVHVRPRQRRVVAPQHCPGPDQVWVPAHPGRGGQWATGHCEQVGPAPRTGWLYVSGYWRTGTFVAGFWRPGTRVGFVWKEPSLNEQDEWAPGYWEPEGEAPDGMIWRSGYWDGQDWIAGGWVPSESYMTYDDNGEIEFFVVGDGHVEELAIPAAGDDLTVVEPEVLAEDEVMERHAEVPQ